ncbi:MAG: sarcosine oxidase subunit gamma family protein [Porticoccaceae bacterium]|nr:sarcosine oxidase subunit gamma family protein [Porticoccaceae bacterium]
MFNGIKLESPLFYFQTSFNKSAAADELFNAEAECGLVVKEAPLSAQLILRGDGSDTLFCAAIAKTLGVVLPLAPGTYHQQGNTSIYWLGPSEWLIIEVGGQAQKIEIALRKALKGHIAIVDVSGGQTSINLRGAGVATVLKKSTVYDFEAWDLATPISGCAAQTTFAKASALISNRSDGSYNLVIRRSFADYIALWLLDAGEEFGCRIEQG